MSAPKKPNITELVKELQEREKCVTCWPCKNCDNGTCEVHCPECGDNLNQDGDCPCLWMMGKKYTKMKPIPRALHAFAEYCVKLPLDYSHPSHVPTGSIRRLAAAYLTNESENEVLREQNSELIKVNLANEEKLAKLEKENDILRPMAAKEYKDGTEMIERIGDLEEKLKECETTRDKFQRVLEYLLYQSGHKDGNIGEAEMKLIEKALYPSTPPPPMVEQTKASAECPSCGGVGRWYGVAPHRHNMQKTGSIIGSTEISPKEEWPSNFREDPGCEGCGVYTCDLCSPTIR